MPSTLAAFGLRPVVSPAGAPRQGEYTIATGYGTNLFFNAPVCTHTDGTIISAAAGDTTNILGAFRGCQYVSAGALVHSPYWPASTTATEIKAYVIDDPDQEYEIQNAGSVPQTEVGEHCQVASVTSGSTVTGLSAATASNTMTTTASQLVIIGFGKGVDNAPGDTYTVIRVKIAMHPWRAQKAAGV